MLRLEIMLKARGSARLPVAVNPLGTGPVEEFAGKTQQGNRVLLCPAGVTAWDLEGRLGGSADMPLAPQGLAWVRREVQRMAGTRLGVVCCGPDEASQVTAEALGEATGAPVRVLEALAEVHLGLWEGLLEVQLEERCPRTYRQWKEHPELVRPPEGESVGEALDRLMAGVQWAVDRSRGWPSGLVLRPMALALVECRLRARPPGEMWVLMGGQRGFRWYLLPADGPARWFPGSLRRGKGPGKEEEAEGRGSHAGSARLE